MYHPATLGADDVFQLEINRVDCHRLEERATMFVLLFFVRQFEPVSIEREEDLIQPTHQTLTTSLFVQPSPTDPVLLDLFLLPLYLAGIGFHDVLEELRSEDLRFQFLTLTH